MASMNGIIAKISSWGNAVSKNTILQAISSGIMSMFPIIIVGSFASLFSGIPIPAYQEFLTTSGVNVALSAVVNATTNMLGLFFTTVLRARTVRTLGLRLLPPVCSPLLSMLR